MSAVEAGVPGDFPWDFGTLIRLRRLEKGLYQREVYAGVGISHCTLWKWEHGHSVPEWNRGQVVARLATVLDIAVETLEAAIEVSARTKTRTRMYCRRGLHLLHRDVRDRRGLLRCEPCRQEFLADLDDPRHGTGVGFSYWGCSCDRCRQNNNEVDRRNYHNRRSGQPKQKNGNRRVLKAFGQEKDIADWLRDGQCQVRRSALTRRLDQGWSAEEAIGTPPWPRGRGTRKKL